LRYAADLHLHSPFARATSKELTFENMARWARIKGVDLLASADFTHPEWFAETKRKLRPMGNGLYECEGARFALGTEVNCNGYQGGRNRRIHLLLFAPSIEVVERINAALSDKGLLASDGRPTLHMTPRELLETLLHIDERIMLIPAHAWTPHFGMYGSRTGFDSLEECFGNLTPHIHAIETGLSSDPAMNWRMPELDEVSIVSFSDAHSLPKMARELTIIDGELSYDGLMRALKERSIAYTVEFFPEEGKYHQSGHRKCGVNLSPEEVSKTGEACPVCGRRMTLGVMQRTEHLARRDTSMYKNADGFTCGAEGRPPFRSLVGLQQIVAESIGRGVNTKGVRTKYMELVEELGSEMHILMDADISDISGVGGERIAEGVERVREGNIFIVPGYDGVFGKVSVWSDDADEANRDMQDRQAVLL
jgi:uncharacterized protein (TIGR00375 family)